MEKMEQFGIRKDRVDEFYVTIFSVILNFLVLEEVVKLCIILSHGIARVESGFSVNELLLDVNMKNQSLVAQRIVYEEVMKEGGPIKADIDNVMMKPFKRSNRRYKVALEENKQKQTGRKKNEKKGKGRKVLLTLVLPCFIHLMKQIFLTSSICIKRQ